MRGKIQNLIAEENHNEPYTDTELCKRLLVSREYVTLLRKELKILDSRERKQDYICEEIRNLLLDNRDISNLELQNMLQKQGYSISSYLLHKYMKNVKLQSIRADLIGGLPQERTSSETLEKSYHAFENLVGTGGSLHTQIQQAKATMLYPPHGLHCLIVGETGVGKSELAEAMYRFSIEAECLPQTAPFTIFNCADYAENSQLLITQLFGCVKGAYTGAVTERRGLIEQTDGGILFLDEVHRLSSEGQEMLFQLIDKGHFRRLGEADAVRQANVQLIAATTENIETSLLITFKRRIPMLINIPSLVDRPLVERLQLIQRFFGYESARMNAPMQVALDVIKAYILYECKGNIGQLKSDIQVTCAKSFLSYVTKKERIVKVDLPNLSLYVKKGLLRIQSNRQELDALVWKDFHFEPKLCQEPSSMEDDVYSFPKAFYGYIEQRHTTYVSQGMDVQQIKQLIGDEIEQKLQNVIAHIKHRLTPLTLAEVSKVVGNEVIYLAQDILRVAENELGKLDESLVYCLAIHLNATFTRLSQGTEIINPNLEDIKKKFHLEYVVAAKMVNVIREKYQIDLPDDEISYIALYLHGNEREAEGNVGVVVATHGNVGSNMLEIAHKLLNVTHGKSFNMSFEESPHDALERLMAVIISADEGKGVLIMVDLGSLLTFGEIIQTRTKIKVETIGRVDTMMVIEALRRSILPGTHLTELISDIEKLNYIFPKMRAQPQNILRQKAIITICFTGEGVALYCQEQMKKMFGDRLQNIAFLNVGMIGRHDIYKQIQQILTQYDVIAMIGSVDPHIQGIPYISMSELLSQPGVNSSVEYLLNEAMNPVVLIEQKQITVPAVVKKMKILMLDNVHYTKTEILKKMCTILMAGKYVKQGYTEAVFAREKMGSYLINEKVALPHADSSYVNESIIILAKSNTGITWADKKSTKIICLLGLDINGKDGVRYLYQRFQNDEVIRRIEEAATEAELREALICNAN